MAAMETWIMLTVAAAFLQNVRSGLQKHLKGRMGTTGATFVRFGFGLPWAIVFVAGIHFAGGFAFPRLSSTFFAWVTVAAFGQILAQALLIHMFSFRNFTVGTAYSRTEPVQAALFGLIFLGDRISAGLAAAIAICVAGVVLISVAQAPLKIRALGAAILSPVAGIGLASGTAFGIAAVAYRGASLSLGGPVYFMQAAVTLLAAISIQSALLFGWMLWRDRAEIARIAEAWKPSALTGFVGATTSFGWFAAMTLQSAALVKALAQIEMLFAYATSVLIFRESVTRLEIAGCVFITAGIVMLLAVPA